jgi:hypothetical protein
MKQSQLDSKGDRGNSKELQDFPFERAYKEVVPLVETGPIVPILTNHKGAASECQTKISNQESKFAKVLGLSQAAAPLGIAWRPRPKQGALRGRTRCQSEGSRGSVWFPLKRGGDN